jgi:hypothetical protein
MSKLKRKTSAVTTPTVLHPWNALTSPWLEGMNHHGQSAALSPLGALTDAHSINRLIAPNPLDLFAAYRFLLTLLYWKAPDYGGVNVLRADLLGGKMAESVIAALVREESQFDLFHPVTPFLQDPAVREAKVLSPAYLFAEMASGTNVAFFDHGDDATCQLCLRCATQGLARIVPWTQSGGSGKQPSIHGAPPIMVIALGRTLCETLGLNLVPLEGPLGEPQWTGTFRPKPESEQLAIMEALTWNPRRVHFLDQHPVARCSRCGETQLPTVGPIVYEKNEASKVADEYTDEWRDPAAFYRLKDGMSIKSTDEADAAIERDLRRLFTQRFGRKIEDAPESAVMRSNPKHVDWLVVLPCNNPANNKTYDHRLLTIQNWPEQPPPSQAPWPDIAVFAGDPRTIKAIGAIRADQGALAFVRAAATLDAAAWAVVAAAANTTLEANVAAFDVFTSILWPLRNRVSSLPSRQAAWMTLKLMASARTAVRQIATSGKRCRPWEKITRQQPEQRLRNGKKRAYPLRVPRDHRLEGVLRDIIECDDSGNPVDWAGLCQLIHDTLR